MKILGLDVVIEYKKGQAKETNHGSLTMLADYGYIPRTISNEYAENLDVFVGPDEESERIFLAPIMKGDDPAALDEYKVMLHFTDGRAVEDFMKLQYPFLDHGPLMEVEPETFRKVLETQAPLAEKQARDPTLVLPVR